MTPTRGVKFKFCNGSQPNDTKRTVIVRDDVQISTFNAYKGEKMGYKDSKTVINQGQAAQNFFQYSNTVGREEYQNYTARTFEIMEGIVDATSGDNQKDANGATLKGLSRADLEKLRTDKELQKKLGVHVKYDSDEKLYGVYDNKNSDVSIFFDYK